jgi:hypothetical protein
MSQLLRAAIEEEEGSRMGTANPLFAAITTSDQDTLQQLQGEC